MEFKEIFLGIINDFDDYSIKYLCYEVVDDDFFDDCECI